MSRDEDVVGIAESGKRRMRYVSCPMSQQEMEALLIICILKLQQEIVGWQ